MSDDDTLVNGTWELEGKRWEIPSLITTGRNSESIQNDASAADASSDISHLAVSQASLPTSTQGDTMTQLKNSLEDLLPPRIDCKSSKSHIPPNNKNNKLKRFFNFLNSPQPSLKLKKYGPEETKPIKNHRKLTHPRDVPLPSHKPETVLGDVDLVMGNTHLSEQSA